MRGLIRKRYDQFSSGFLVTSTFSRPLEALIFMVIMASLPKKKKLSKSEKKKMLSEKGKKGAEARGIGTVARQEFTLPSQWETEVRQGETRKLVDYYSPGKTKYRTQREVGEELLGRGMELCFEEDEETSQHTSESESNDWPEDEMSIPSNSQVVNDSKVEVERRLVVCESTQITRLVDDINKTSRCSTKDCEGKFPLCFKC